LDAHPPVDLKDGRQLVEKDGKAHIKQGNTVVVAPDATYATKGGKTVKVEQSRIVQDDSAAPVAAAAPTAPVEQTEPVAQAAGEWPFAGSVLRIEATDMGEIATVVAADGTESLAPAGEHTMDDGTVVVIGEGGMVMEVRVAAPAEQSAETPAEQPVSQETVLQSKLKDLEKTVADQQKQLVKLGKQPATTAPPNKVVPKQKYADGELRIRAMLGQLTEDEAKENGLHLRRDVVRDFHLQQKVKAEMYEQFRQITKRKTYDERIKVVQNFINTSVWDGEDWMKNIVYNLIQSGQMTDLANRYVYPMTGVKGTAKVPRVSLTDNILQTFTCELTDSGNIDADNFEVNTCNFASLVKFCITDFDESWAQLLQTPGFSKSGVDIFPTTLGDLLLNLVLRKLQAEIEAVYINGDTDTYLTGALSLCNGLLKNIRTRGGYNEVEISALTTSNIATEFAKMYDSIIEDTELAGMGFDAVKWFVSPKTAGIYKQALASATGDANFSLNGDKTLDYLGYEIVPIKQIPNDKILATFTRSDAVGGSNLILATDLESDFARLEVEPYPHPNTHIVGVKTMFRLGASVFYPEHVHLAETA